MNTPRDVAQDKELTDPGRCRSGLDGEAFTSWASEHLLLPANI